MKKIMKKSILIILGLFLILTTLSPLFAVYAETKDLNDIKKQVEKSEKELQDIKGIQTDLKADLDSELKKLEEYRSEIKDLEAEISSLKNDMSKIEEEIKETESRIEERELKIEETEEKVKSYIKSSQSTLRVNSLFEFLMGSEDFSTMLLRLEGMSAIKRYNEDLIRGLVEEKEALEEDKLRLDDEKEKLNVKKKAIDIEVEKIKVYEKHIVEVIKELREKEAELDKKIQEVNHKKSSDLNKIKEIEAEMERIQKAEEERIQKELEAQHNNSGSKPTTPPSSTNTGFGMPVPGGSYHVSASVWRYPAQYGGGPHMGVDLGINRGTPAYAVGNGIVVATQSGCHEGNSYCGGGYGNYVSYIVNVNGHNYGILFAHLSSVSVGTTRPVVKGQLLGTTGNTGLSTGPHIHIETIDMGSGSLTDAWNRWDGSYNFGTGPAAWGGRRCDAGFGVPCRLHPQRTLGLY